MAETDFVKQLAQRLVDATKDGRVQPVPFGYSIQSDNGKLEITITIGPDVQTVTFQRLVKGIDVINYSHILSCALDTALAQADTPPSSPE